MILIEKDFLVLKTVLILFMKSGLFQNLLLQQNLKRFLFIYLYFLDISSVKVDISNINIFSIIDREDVKFLTKIEIINKCLSYCENLVFL